MQRRVRNDRRSLLVRWGKHGAIKDRITSIKIRAQLVFLLFRVCLFKKKTKKPNKRRGEQKLRHRRSSVVVDDELMRGDEPAIFFCSAFVFFFLSCSLNISSVGGCGGGDRYRSIAASLGYDYADSLYDPWCYYYYYLGTKLQVQFSLEAEST